MTQQLLDAEADAEHQRLAYVALTRAQVRLYLPSYADGALGKAAMYQPIQRCLAPCVGRPRGPAERALFETIAVPVGGPEPAPPPSDALASFRAPRPPAPAELAPLAPLRCGLTMLSYTRLAHDANVAAIAVHPGDALAIDPAEFDVDDTAGEVGPTDLPPGADAGLLLHDILEVADLRAAQHAPDLAA
ncbi:MAG TPA: hypothetical protein VK607_17570 [Kofleriaceae bacterium]|nr:hypothetical protein [Kofleriaceae bacterium]